MKKSFFLIITLILASNTVQSQVYWSKYNLTDTYLSASGVVTAYVKSNLAIDNNNNKWFIRGSDDDPNDFGSLIKFDGSSFIGVGSNFILENQFATQNNALRKFAFDSNDNAYELYEGQIRKFNGTESSNIYLPIAALSNEFKIGSDNNIWFIGGDPSSLNSADSAALVKFDGQNFETYNFASVQLITLISPRLKINTDSNNNVWFAVSNGVQLILYKFDGSIFNVFTTTIPNGSEITDLEIDNQNNVLVSTNLDGFFKFDGTNWVNFTITDGLLSNEVTSIKSDNVGNIWVNTNGTVSKLTGSTFTHFSNTEVGNINGKNDIESDNFGNFLFLSSGTLSINCLNAMTIPTITSNGGTNFNFCPGELITLTSSSGDSFLWVDENYVFNPTGANFPLQNVNNQTLNLTDQDQHTFSNSGSYSVYINDSNGCRAQSESIFVTVNTPISAYPICMVTSANNKNIIIWQEDPKAFKYKIYKQNNITSAFDLLHEQDIDSLSEYIDISSDVNTVSASYKISVVDSCGNEGSLGQYHKTMLLTSSLGTNNNVNLNWNAYEGFTYLNFEIWRSIDGVNYNLLATVANNTFSYIDNNPNNNSYYQIRVVSPAPCTSTRGTYGNVTSNIVDKNGNSINGLKEFDSPVYTIAPNPTSSALTIKLFSELSNFKLSIYDVSGQKLLEQLINGNTETLDVSTYAKGIYFLEIGNVREKFVVE